MFRLASCVAVLSVWATAAQAVTIHWVTVGDPDNVADTEVMTDGTTGYGSVADVYQIGKYEVTNGQYCEFLNAVAANDPNHLYHTAMGGGWNDIGGIARSGSLGSYTYTVRPNRRNRPVNYVSFYDACRFANWLNNGQPGLVTPVAQDDNSTEDGAYDMSRGSSVVRKPGAIAFLPSEDEWYKAAYYKGRGTDAGYWDYPTRSDTPPTPEMPPGTDMTNGSANYYAPGNYVDPTYFTTQVGAYTAKPSDSAYGTFDQAGNLWEWNETDILGDGSRRGVRGGSLFDDYDGVLRASWRSHTIPTDVNHKIGFRVASIPEPSTGVLLTMGAVGLLVFAWRKRRRR